MGIIATKIYIWAKILKPPRRILTGEEARLVNLSYFTAL
jgi:hypothetical protein